MKSSVGLGLRHSFHNYVLENKPAVPFFEIITENYLYFDGAPRSFLKKIRNDYDLVFHGVSLSIGSLEPVRQDYLVQLKKMILEFKPLWVSDHLCWTFNGKENSHDLLPIPFTKNALDRIVRKTQFVQEFLGQKIYLENPSAYVDFKSNEYPEEEFIKELCDRSGCGLLLDLNNLVVNQYNLGYDPKNYLSKVKNCDVKQLHLAGHTIKQNVRIDTHDSPISQEVLDLIPISQQFWPNAHPMIEWDDKIPPIQDLLDLRNEIELLWNTQSPVKIKDAELTNTLQKLSITKEEALFENFWTLLKCEDYIPSTKIDETDLFNQNLPTPPYVGMNVYSSAYYNRLLDVLEKTFPVLNKALGDYFKDVGLEYIKAYPSTFSSIDFIGENLSRFILEKEFSFDLGADKLILSDIANFEYSRNIAGVLASEQSPTLSVLKFNEADWSNTKIKIKSETLVLRFNSKIHESIQSLEMNNVPEIPALEETYYVFYRTGDLVSYKNIDASCASFLNSFKDFKSFTEYIDDTNVASLKLAANYLFENENLFCVKF
jgi:uncharacterized protein